MLSSNVRALIIGIVDFAAVSWGLAIRGFAATFWPFDFRLNTFPLACWGALAFVPFTAAVGLEAGS
jgi:hypothetical protein